MVSGYSEIDPLLLDSCTHKPRPVRGSIRITVENFIWGKDSAGGEFTRSELLHILLNVLGAALVQPLMQWLSIDGTYPFLWSNVYAFCALIAAVGLARKTPDLLETVTSQMLILQFAANIFWIAFFVLLPLVTFFFGKSLLCPK